MMYVGIAIALVVAFVLFKALTAPKGMTVSRSIVIDDAPAEAFQQVNDFRNWKNWSPWACLDPQMKETYSATTSGPGAHYAWAGNMKVGAGEMTITDSVPARRVGIKLDFRKPMAAHNQTIFTFDPQDGGTRVTWTMIAPDSPFMGRLMGVFMDCEKMCGDSFIQGLQKMKSVVEAGKLSAVARS